MPYSIKLQGRDFPNVPALIVPKTGGGTARFYADLKPYLLRPDAELVETYTHDSLVVTDDEVTLPAWKSTEVTTILASADLTPQITLDYEGYDWFVSERFLTTPVYSTDTPAKGRNEYSIGSVMYELVNIPANSFKTANGTLYASRSVYANVCACYRLLYWLSASALAMHPSASHGIHQVTTAPSISSDKWTIKTPAVSFRGHSSYLPEAVYGTVTDIRRQFVIEVYKAPKSNMNIDGWGLQQQALRILNDVKSNNGVLT